MGLNVKGLDDTLTFIEANPERLDQTCYGRKNSASEIVADFVGWHLLMTNQARFKVLAGVQQLVPLDSSVNCFEAARRSLGLTSGQARMLIIVAHSLKDVRTTVSYIKKGVTWERTDLD